jgi:ABC-2 type transport system permease protein
MLGQAVYEAGGGADGQAVLRVLPALLLLPTLVWLWGRALDRNLTTVATGETAARRRRSRGELPLLFSRLGFVRPTPWGAVAARGLRYVAREPRHKVNLVNTILLGAGLPLFFAIRSGGDLSDSSVLLATVAGYLAILSANNQFGMDGGALWLDIVAGDTIRAVLIGKNLAVLVQVLPTITVVGVTMAAITGGWSFLPGALVLGVAALGSGLATANVISLRFPLPLPDTRNPFAGAGGGQGCATGLILFVCTLVQAILVIPVGVAAIVGVVAGPAWLVLAALLSAAYGVGLWFLGLRLASDHARTHEPERILAVDPSRSS